jgi:hypothetical protein
LTNEWLQRRGSVSTSIIEIKSKKRADMPTTRRIFVNGQELCGVRDITVKNKAGDYVDFLDISLTFLVRESDLILTDESSLEPDQLNDINIKVNSVADQETFIEKIKQGVLNGFACAHESRGHSDRAESLRELSEIGKIRKLSGNVCGVIGKWFLKLRKRLLNGRVK